MSTSQFHTDPSVQHIGSTQRSHGVIHTFSAPKTPQFNTKIPRFPTKNPSVPHQKPLSSTQGCVELRGLQCGTEGFLLLHWGVELRSFRCGTEGFLVLNQGVFGVELRGFWRGTDGCWTEEFLVWNWGNFGAEKDWPFCVELMCWTEGVWNWGGPVKTYAINSGN